MEIAIIAHDLKKELMTEFCIAYCGILSKHNLCATSITAKYIADATGLEIERLMAGIHGGKQQIASRISCNEIDCLSAEGVSEVLPSSCNFPKDLVARVVTHCIVDALEVVEVDRYKHERLVASLEICKELVARKAVRQSSDPVGNGLLTDALLIS